jgi:hypothetical protein
MSASANGSNDPMVSLFPDPGVVATMSRASRTNSFTAHAPGAPGHSAVADSGGGLHSGFSSPIGHSVMMGPPPHMGVATHENGMGRIAMTTGVSPVTTMAIPQIGDSMSDQADSLGGDAEFDFDSLWSWPWMGGAPGGDSQGQGHAVGPGGVGEVGAVGSGQVAAATAAFHPIGLMMNPAQFEGFAGFMPAMGPTTTTSAGTTTMTSEGPVSLDGVPMFAPPPY